MVPHSGISYLTVTPGCPASKFFQILGQCAWMRGDCGSCMISSVAGPLLGAPALPAPPEVVVPHAASAPDAADAVSPASIAAPPPPSVASPAVHLSHSCPCLPATP